MKKLLFLLTLLLALTAGCKKPAVTPTTDPSKEPVETPSTDPGDKSADPSGDEKSEDPSVEPGPEMTVTIETGGVDEETLTLSHALIYATITIENAPEGFQPVECFITYGFETNADELIESGGLEVLSAGTSDWVDLEAEAEDLEMDTKYYYVAWTKIDDVLYKGKVRNFKTKNYGDYAEAVDLGLSVKWCNVNIGAMKPEEIGLYFAWGEIVSKTSFTWDNYSLYENNKFTKYKGADGGDSAKKLSISDDAAYKLLGREWRMPTVDDFKELKEKCSFKVNEDNDCLIVTGPNDNTLTLPLGGYWDSYGLTDVAECANYWSSEYRFDEEPMEAYELYFSSGNVFPDEREDRYVGLNIRAVARE